MSTIRTAFYSGSFDPVTNGHIDVLKSALAGFEHVIIGIGVHAVKKGLFDFNERRSLIETSLSSVGLNQDRVQIKAFDNLVVDAARAAGAHVIVRGLRDATDFDYEMQMSGMNATMAEDIPTLFIPSSVATRPISATLVRQIAAMGGDVTPFVPEPVAKALANLKSRED